MSILTITLNAAVDTTHVVAKTELGGVNRILRSHARAGGKGNNVARVLATLGRSVFATGFLGGRTGEAIDRGIRDAGVEARFAWLDSGESRTCHTILDEESRLATEFLESGPELSERDMDGFLDLLPDLVSGAEAVVISGSAPPGATTAFLELVGTLARAGTDRLAIDASGSTLTALLGGKPDLVTPNEMELRMLMDRLGTEGERIAFVQGRLLNELLAPGGRVLLTLGGDGALLITESTVLRARSPAVDVVNTVGCGDALLAGYVDGWLSDLDDATVVRHAVATGTAAALRDVAGEVDVSEVRRLWAQVDVDECG